MWECPDVSNPITSKPFIQDNKNHIYQLRQNRVSPSYVWNQGDEEHVKYVLYENLINLSIFFTASAKNKVP